MADGGQSRCEPDERSSTLLERKRLKMASTIHAFVRGNPNLFYEWLRGAAGKDLPEGPPMWICGDCHLGNLGPLADSNGDVAVQMRDFDQTVVGNPAHDLLRLGLSLATLARSSRLPGIATVVMIEELERGYEDALERGAGDAPERKPPSTIRDVLHKARDRSFHALLVERVRNTKPTIPLGPRFWPLAAEERGAVERLFLRDDLRRLVTTIGCRDQNDIVELADAAFWVKGCSSLGRLRFAVLARVRGRSVEKGRLCLLDFKEAVAPDAPRNSQAFMPYAPAERVIAGARRLSPHLGERMLAVPVLGRSVFVRELLPQDLKIDPERLSRKEAARVAWHLGSIIGRAHARVLNDTARAGWRAELARRSAMSAKGTPWLWTGIVDLIARHEAAYLEHCRRVRIDVGEG